MEAAAVANMATNTAIIMVIKVDGNFIMVVIEIVDVVIVENFMPATFIIFMAAAATEIVVLTFIIIVVAVVRTGSGVED